MAAHRSAGENRRGINPSMPAMKEPKTKTGQPATGRQEPTGRSNSPAPRWLSHILELLQPRWKHPDSTVRERYARHLGTVKNYRLLKRIAERDPEWRVREIAIQGLARAAKKDDPLLERIAQGDPVEEVRVRATKALKNPEILQRILTSDPSLKVREAADWTISWLEQQERLRVAHLASIERQRRQNEIIAAAVSRAQDEVTAALAELFLRLPCRFPKETSGDGDVEQVIAEVRRLVPRLSSAEDCRQVGWLDGERYKYLLKTGHHQEGMVHFKDARYLEIHRVGENRFSWEIYDRSEED